MKVIESQDNGNAKHDNEWSFFSLAFHGIRLKTYFKYI